MKKEYNIKWPHKVTITTDSHGLTIKRKGLMNLASHGLKGDKRIPFKNITSVEVKKPGLTNGYIQFAQLGSGESRGGLFSATEDENTVMIATKKVYKNMLELKEAIESYNDDFSDNDTIVNETTQSPAEQLKEYKELLDMEIITPEEFEEKKKQLLNL